MKPADEAPHLLAVLQSPNCTPDGRAALLHRVLGLMLDRLQAAGWLPHDTDRGNLDHCVIVALRVADAQLRPVADVIRLCVHALEADEVTPELQARIAVIYAQTDPDLGIGRTRRAQVRQFNAAGAEARRKFTDRDHERWCRLRSRHYSMHSIRRAAELIAEREGIPQSVESVRKALSKEKG